MSNVEVLILSQKKLSIILGGLGIALPTLLYLGNKWIFEKGTILNSISGYYYSNMRDVFVGILFSLGIFLVAYEGYGFWDRILSTIAGAFAIIVALFPTVKVGEDPELVNNLHIAAAASLYFILAIFSLFFFTKSDPKRGKTLRKQIRNIIYYICGAFLLATLVILFITELEYVDKPINNSTFWLEYIANSAFGTAWLVKGEGIFFLNDDPILKMTPWEILGVIVLVLLGLGSFFMLTDILIL